MICSTDDHLPPMHDDEREVLAAVAWAMIPASAEYDMPGADDPAILADMLRSLGRDAGVIGQALRILRTAAGGDPGRLSTSGREALFTGFRSDHPAMAAALELLVAECYYRDDRVMRAIGMEPRPPFPKGYELEQGDWSLLDPVRQRGPIYRDPSDRQRGA